MAKITNNLKRVQKTLSLIVRAVEFCFDKPVISKVLCLYQNEQFSIELNALIFSDWYLDIELESEDIHSCIEALIYKVMNSTNKIIEKLTKEEALYASEIKKYGKPFSESPAIKLSTTLMFKQIVGNIR
jgi:hypothetical protein